jgi:hypothetical protein
LIVADAFAGSGARMSLMLAQSGWLVDWIYDRPFWQVGMVIVGGAVVFSLAGLMLVDRVTPRALRTAHNDLTGAGGAIVGTVIAVLLAFIRVATWESYDRAGDLADAEAGAVSQVYFQSRILTWTPVQGEIQAHARRYLDIVIKSEWPKQRRGALQVKDLDPGRAELLAIDSALVGVSPANIGQGNIQAQMLRTVDQAVMARRARVLAADGHVPAPVWRIMLLGTVLAIGYTWFFGASRLAMHMVATGMVAASLSLVVLLIVVTDYPFRGELSVDTHPYELARAVMGP